MKKQRVLVTCNPCDDSSVKVISCGRLREWSSCHCYDFKTEYLTDFAQPMSNFSETLSFCLSNLKFREHAPPHRDVRSRFRL